MSREVMYTKPWGPGSNCNKLSLLVVRAHSQECPAWPHFPPHSTSTSAPDPTLWPSPIFVPAEGLDYSYQIPTDCSFPKDLDLQNLKAELVHLTTE